MSQQRAAGCGTESADPQMGGQQAAGILYRFLGRLSAGNAVQQRGTHISQLIQPRQCLPGPLTIGHKPSVQQEHRRLKMIYKLLPGP